MARGEEAWKGAVTVTKSDAWVWPDPDPNRNVVDLNEVHSLEDLRKQLSSAREAKRQAILALEKYDRPKGWWWKASITPALWS